MKVVLFCGGFGMRLYPKTKTTPKPLISIGKKPILWHLMKYYSYFGHNEFIFCLGYKGDLIRTYFSNGNLNGWKITFVDTGLNSNIGQRLKAVERYLDGEDHFLANYSDAVTDLHLPDLVDFYTKRNKIACLLSVKPFHTYDAVTLNGDGIVKEITPLAQHNVRINGGFFIFKNEIFKYMKEGEELVREPFQRLVSTKELIAYEYNGFWANMDTYKDKQQLDLLAANKQAPWEVWLSP
jgi:glucose-1-phosphate cytidylyltransferase